MTEQTAYRHVVTGGTKPLPADFDKMAGVMVEAFGEVNIIVQGPVEGMMLWVLDTKKPVTDAQREQVTEAGYEISEM